MRRTVRLTAFAAFALSTAVAQGQSAQRWSLQLSGLSVGVQGEAYDGLSQGMGMEAQIRFTPSVWSLGAGLQYSAHDLDIDGSAETVSLAGAFIEPRRIIDVGGSTFAPYVSARLAFLRQSIDMTIDGTAVSASTSGAQVNAGGGVLFRLSPRLNLDLGATYGLINFGDVEVNVPGYGRGTIDGTSGNGRNLVVRVGLAVGVR
jgi:hypothetical protein